VRREVLSRVGGFDLEWDLAIDYDLWLRAARHYDFDYVEEELVRYRTGHGNLSRRTADRVETALAIVHRAQSRRRLAEEVPAACLAESHASTCRTLAYLLRASEPAASMKWYLRALRRPAGRLRSLRGLVLSLARFASGRRAAAEPANAASNR
jgi:hypothetical protein